MAKASLKELIAARNKINELRIQHGEKPLAPGRERRLVEKQVKEHLDFMSENFPDWEPLAMNLYPANVIKWFKGKERGLFIRVPQQFVDEGHLNSKEGGLEASEWLVCTIWLRFANFTKTVNKEGMDFAEAFVGREKVSKLSGYSLSSVDKITAALIEKGYLINLDEKRTNKRRPRAVALMLGWQDDF